MAFDENQQKLADKSLTGFDATPDLMKQGFGVQEPDLLNLNGKSSYGINWNQVQTDLGNFKNELLGGGYNSFQPGNANIQSGTSQDQINQSYQRSQGGLDSQRTLMTALQQQNGLGNQSNFLAQQQQLANQLQMQSMGQGPNPAMAQLAQATQANTANQAALMAGQRGASANSGLIARQAAMQGGANQQAAAGQAATMGANQQLQAQQQLGAQQQAMQNVAGAQAGNMINTNTGYNQLAQNQQQMLLNANAAANNANVSMQSNMNNVGAQTSISNQQNNKGILGGVLSGVGAVFGMAHGGMVPQGYADGGLIGMGQQVPQAGPSSSLGQMLAKGQDMSAQLAGTAINSPTFQSPVAPPAEDYKKDRQMGANAAKGVGGISKFFGGSGGSGSGGLASMFSSGGKVSGKPAVKGDSASNDTVPAMLSPGEVVIPRSVMQSKNAPEAAKRFVAAVLAKQKRTA